MQPDFRTVTHLLSKAYSRGMIAAYLGVHVRTYEAYRGQPEQRHYRRPPSDWRNRLRPLIRDAAWWYGMHADEGAVSLLTQAMEPE